MPHSGDPPTSTHQGSGSEFSNSPRRPSALKHDDGTPRRASRVRFSEDLTSIIPPSPSHSHVRFSDDLTSIIPPSPPRSHVRFSEDLTSIIPPSSYELGASSTQPADSPSTLVRNGGGTQWHIPDYREGLSRYPQWGIPTLRTIIPDDVARSAIPPQSRSRSRGRDDSRSNGNQSGNSADDAATLYSGRPRDSHDGSVYSLSSYQHPYEIQPPPGIHTSDAGRESVPQTGYRPPVEEGSEDEIDKEKRTFAKRLRDSESRRNSGVDDVPRNGGGVLANLIDLYGVENGISDGNGTFAGDTTEKFGADPRRPWKAGDEDLKALDACQVIDPDDPLVTGVKKEHLDDREDLEKARLRAMDYKTRRKVRQRIKIEFNITSIINRQMFLMRLAKALMTFGAPSHRIESQLLSAARILEIDAEFIHIPGVIICSFGDADTKTSETHFVKSAGRLSLGSLHDVHQIYREVVHDEISAKQATARLNEVLVAPPLYGRVARLFLAFWLSALICVLAFGGAFLDMWVAGAGAMLLCLMQIGVAGKSQIYANVFEITMTIVISFLARGLSSIRSQIFCYTAISSAGIVGILPGYLILSSSLELASKNIVCGSVKMVYALIYTLFLAFGLQIGSDFYLLFDSPARHEIYSLAAKMTDVVTITGTFTSDIIGNKYNNGFPSTSTFTFTNSTPVIQYHMVDGCYRPPEFPWYLQPFPWWSQFFIVPLFSIMSSLMNLQPLFTYELVVMVVISCTSYAANKVANHFIFNQSDIVSSIGAFAVGILGNAYSRRMGGTAFTSMVTGVLFLVPSGLSQAGGITAQGDGIEIGGAMIEVTIGITVGLFMSQALVYMFGTRKNAAIFSF